MRKMLIAALLGSVMMASAQAASLSGKILDQVTGQPINVDYSGMAYSGANAFIYKYNKMFHGWELYTAAYPETDGSFQVAGLPAGQYVVGFQGLGHKEEYYQNAADWELKKVISLTESKDLVLQDALLTPYPLYMKTVVSDVALVPSSGGTVQLSVNVVNGAATNKTTKLWVVAYNEKYQNYFTPTAYSPLTTKPISVDLVPGDNNVTLPVNIPATYANGGVTLYVSAGKNLGDPSAPVAMTSLYKGDDVIVVNAKNASNPLHPVASANDVPLRIADDGTVLARGVIPKH